ncbi:zinc-binding protein A33 [Trichomycterus rosablanca]|uniref:zinc-binding protein A33 n=1 Tax=Trichomycterus rosablanca TaxID=2290929 RepID=UPI002F35EEF9
MELYCPACHNLFFYPVTLHCGHTFCLACLENSKTTEACEVQPCCLECGVEYHYNEFQERNLELGNIVEMYRSVITVETKDQVKPSCSNHEEKASNIVSNIREKVANGSSVSWDDPCVHRSRLAPVMTDIQAKIALVEDLLDKAKEKEIAVKASNNVLKQKVSTALAEMVDLLKSYSTTEMDLLVAQLKPSEEIMETNVRKLLDLHRQLKETKLQINTLLKEQDNAKFSIGIQVIEALAASLVVEPQKFEPSTEKEINTDMTNMCADMEQRNSDLRLKLGAAYRCLRSLINPSEVTFDPNTLHPNLVLSEDLKTVSFSVAKQPYTTGPQRFANLFQVLSSQSFSNGDHHWILQAEGCSWVMGLCYEGLPRSGTGSGLESSSGAWCLMWFNNLIKAYDGGKETPLQLRTPFLQSLEIRLSFSNNSVEFYSISNVTGIKTHLYTFGVSLTEPVFLAVRMMSCQPKARITLCK